MPTRSIRYSYIVARSTNGVIGCENKIPWKVRADLQQFRRITTGKPLIMGRKTFDSIGKPLPERVNIVISRERDLELPGVTVVSSKEAAIAVAEKHAELCNTDEVIIIGGEQIFGMFFDKVSCIYLTEIEVNVSGDAVFNFDFAGWLIKEEKYFPKSKHDEYPSVFRKYERLRPFVARRALYEVRVEMNV